MQQKQRKRLREGRGATTVWQGGACTAGSEGKVFPGSTSGREECIPTVRTKLAARDLHNILHVALQHLYAVHYAPRLDVQFAELQGGQPLTVAVLHSSLERLDGIVRLAENPATNSITCAPLP